MTRPSWGTGRTPKAGDLPEKKSGKYFKRGLDRPNQSEAKAENRRLAHRNHAGQ
jgi:hypothetical protein